MTGWQEVLLALGGMSLFVILVFLAAGIAAGIIRRDRPRRTRDRAPRRHG
jgi:hypothetical protein